MFRINRRGPIGRRAPIAFAAAILLLAVAAPAQAQFGFPIDGANSKNRPVPTTIQNSATSPARTLDVDARTRMPIARSVGISLAGSGNGGTLFDLRIPAGKRLVIETASCNLFAPTGFDGVDCNLSVTFSPDNAAYLSLLSRADEHSKGRTLDGTQYVHILVPAGGKVGATLNVWDAVAAPSGVRGSVDIVGYFEDATAP